MKKKVILLLLLAMTISSSLIACSRDELIVEVGDFDSTEDDRHSEYDEHIEASVEDNMVISLAEAEVGDVVYFGHYEQDNNYSNGKEEIAWRVLKTNQYGNSSAGSAGIRLTVLSEFVLDVHNKEYLTEWLNNAFMKEAFTENEREQFFVVDKPIGLLKESELDQYFNLPEDAFGRPTEYVKTMTGNEDYINWWLFGDKYMETGYRIGSKFSVETLATSGQEGVRPTLTIDVYR